MTFQDRIDSFFLELAHFDYELSSIDHNYTFLHRANQHFSKEQDVFDVLHYDDLGRYKRRITPFIRWDLLPILKPRDF